MAGSRDDADRPPLDSQRLRDAGRLVALAWRDLPADHRGLLESIGAAQHEVVDRPLGAYVNELLISSGHPGVQGGRATALEDALGVWIPPLRLVLIDAGHPALVGLARASYEAMIVRAAWHEWGHALSLSRATAADVAAGERLLALAPAGIAEFVRAGGYRPKEYVHEMIAEIYATLMARRRRGETRQPIWLSDEIYELIQRVCGWNP